MICILKRCRVQRTRACIGDGGIQRCTHVDPPRTLTWYLKLLCQPLPKRLGTEHTLLHADIPHRDEGTYIQSTHSRVLACRKGRGGELSSLQLSTMTIESSQPQVVGSSNGSQGGLLGMPQYMGTFLVAMAGKRRLLKP